MTMIPSVSDASFLSQLPTSITTTSQTLPVGPRVVIPSKQTLVGVSGNTRMSNKKPSFSSVTGLGLSDSIPVTPTESISPNTTNNSEKVGRWTDQEHDVFLEGLTKYGKQWKTIATSIGTRTVVQVRTHAQKYFQKMEKSKQSDGPFTGALTKTVPHHQARPMKTNSGNKRKSSPSPVSPAGRKKQIKTVATMPSNIIRKVSIGRGTISPPPETC
jgi:SHAQKYF class myb-like DNA-binding protein